MPSFEDRMDEIFAEKDREGRERAEAEEKAHRARVDRRARWLEVAREVVRPAMKRAEKRLSERYGPAWVNSDDTGRVELIVQTHPEGPREGLSQTPRYPAKHEKLVIDDETQRGEGITESEVEQRILAFVEKLPAPDRSSG